MSGIDRARWVALFGEFSEKALKLASSWWAAEIRIILVKLLVENHFFKNRHFRKFSKKSVFFCRRRFVVDIRRPKPVIMPIPHDRPSHATKTRGFENVGEPLLWFKISLVHLAFYPNWCIFRSLFGSTFGSFLGQFLVQYLFIFCSKKVLLFIDFRRFLWSYVYDKIPPIFFKTEFVKDREFCRRHTTKTRAWAPPSLIQCFQPKGHWTMLDQHWSIPSRVAAEESWLPRLRSPCKVCTYQNATIIKNALAPSKLSCNMGPHG